MLIIFSPLETQRHRPILSYLVAFFLFLFFLLWANGGGGCGLLPEFVVDVFVIILMIYLYYFNQITKNIDPLILGVKK